LHLARRSYDVHSKYNAKDCKLVLHYIFNALLQLNELNKVGSRQNLNLQMHWNADLDCFNLTRKPGAKLFRQHVV
jgi:hypothetical protein